MPAHDVIARRKDDPPYTGAHCREKYVGCDVKRAGRVGPRRLWVGVLSGEMHDSVYSRKGLSPRTNSAQVAHNDRKSRLRLLGNVKQQHRVAKSVEMISKLGRQVPTTSCYGNDAAFATFAVHAESQTGGSPCSAGVPGKRWFWIPKVATCFPKVVTCEREVDGLGPFAGGWAIQDAMIARGARSLGLLGSQRTLASTYDYIVVGAGSAGCVLANRLSASGNKSVLLIEGGGDDQGHWSSIFLHMPTALSIPMNMTRYNWGFVSDREPGLGGRRLHCPRGRVLGGSSSINGMVYVRGNPMDFDNWEDLGATGWGYQNVLPYFRRAETWAGGANAYRGGDGPLAVTNGACTNPLYAAFIEAGRQAGFPVSGDYNGYQQEGFGPMAMTVDKSGRRSSTSRAYLDPVRNAANLTIQTNAQVDRILFGPRRDNGIPDAVGVDVRIGSYGESTPIRARQEVIIAAGAIGSPQLLQVSGIGNRKHLQSIGVTPVCERRGVGENLQDHLEVLVQQQCTQPVTLNSQLDAPAKFTIGVRWVMSQLFGGAISPGLGGTNHFESGAFVRSTPDAKYPNVQFHFCPAAIRYDGSSPGHGHGFQAHVGPMRSKSRGYVRALSPDVRQHPSIFFNYMSLEEDWEDFRACVRLARRVFAQPAMAPFRGAEIAPGESIQSDAEIDEFIRNCVESAYHPCGTCRMGRANDPLAVVDPDTRVIGVNRLRVVDSSIFPSITNGNLNAPTIMVAERASDLILGKPPEPPADVPVCVCVT